MTFRVVNPLKRYLPYIGGQENLVLTLIYICMHSFTFIGEHATGRDGRICFAIAWFPTEELANQCAELVRNEGRTYNGGMFHGMPCGRDSSWDRYANKRPVDERGVAIQAEGFDRGKVTAYAVTH